jgi:hypothetical protein
MIHGKVGGMKIIRTMAKTWGKDEVLRGRKRWGSKVCLMAIGGWTTLPGNPAQLYIYVRGRSKSSQPESVNNALAPLLQALPQISGTFVNRSSGLVKFLFSLFAIILLCCVEC